MQIVIDIDEYDKEWIHNAYDIPNEIKSKIVDAIENGTPLPKHGRLIDADALEKKMCDREEELGDDRALWESSAVSVALDMFAPTIIEADKGVLEKINEKQDSLRATCKAWDEAIEKNGYVN